MYLTFHIYFYKSIFGSEGWIVSMRKERKKKSKVSIQAESDFHFKLLDVIDIAFSSHDIVNRASTTSNPPLQTLQKKNVPQARPQYIHKPR